MKKMIVSLVAIALFATAGYAGETCGLGHVSYDESVKSSIAPQGDIVLSESEALMFGLLATSIVPVGEPESFRTELDNGDVLEGIRTVYEVTTAAGSQVRTTVTCTHQGCTDPDCQPEGCEPQRAGNGWACTPPGCIKLNNSCGTQTPKGCTKTVSVSTAQQVPGDF
ncbi:hypothetical protein ABI59_08595 [Acidobacteria bacterium Mor1]|nr:hypothetical protein ABI59_08595 [Acidobacteria bacterium Mor1]